METVNEKQLAPTKARVTKMQTTVESLVISDEQSQAQATNILSGIKSVAKEIKTKKEEITKPMNEALRAARALFSPLEQNCKDAEVVVKNKMVAYHKQVEEERRKQEEKLAKRVEKGTMKVETAARKSEEAPQAKTHVVSGKGSATIRKIKQFKVVDLSKLPIEYLLPNTTAIRQAMNAGTKLPGVEYWEEDSVSAR